MKQITGVIAVSVLLSGVACVKRHEIVAVFPDGSGKLVFAFEGDPDDLRSGDALPTPESGWRVQEHLEIKPGDNPGDPDKQELKVTGSRNIAAGDPWPGTYAEEGTRLERISLKFPTTVTIEERSDGTYYHFRRVYRARSMARVKYLRERILDRDSTKELRDKDPDELTPQEHRTLVGAFLEFEREKARTFLDQAIDRFEDYLPQDAWLAARAAVGVAFDAPSLAETIVSISKDEDAENRLEDLGQQLRSQLEEHVRVALTGRGVAPALAKRVIDAAHLASETYEVSEDLGDEQWFVSVVLPGRIIAHNSNEDPEPFEAEDDEPGDDDESNEAAELRALAAELQKHVATGARFESISWDVDGDALNDVDVILAATSFVPHETEE